MYYKKLIPILTDLEDKEVEVAGGSVVGMILSITNSLIIYICNLTIGKKRYLDVEQDVIKIKDKAENLKNKTLSFIDKDKEILEEILDAYKLRKERPDKLEETNKKATEFCMEVTQNALETLKLAEQVSKVGNKMLSSDFKICVYYAFSSIEASIVNVKINLDSITDINLKDTINEKCKKIKAEAEEIRKKFY